MHRIRRRTILQGLSGLAIGTLLDERWRQRWAWSFRPIKPVNSARLLAMSGPALDATSGVKIQGAAVAIDGTFTPGPAYTAQISGSTVTCYLDALSAILLKAA